MLVGIFYRLSKCPRKPAANSMILNKSRTMARFVQKTAYLARARTCLYLDFLNLADLGKVMKLVKIVPILFFLALSSAAHAQRIWCNDGPCTTKVEIEPSPKPTKEPTPKEPTPREPARREPTLREPTRPTRLPKGDVDTPAVKPPPIVTPPSHPVTPAPPPPLPLPSSNPTLSSDLRIDFEAVLENPSMTQTDKAPRMANLVGGFLAIADLAVMYQDYRTLMRINNMLYLHQVSKMKAGETHYLRIVKVADTIEIFRITGNSSVDAALFPSGARIYETKLIAPDVNLFEVSRPRGTLEDFLRENPRARYLPKFTLPDNIDVVKEIHRIVDEVLSTGRSKHGPLLPGTFQRQ